MCPLWVLCSKQVDLVELVPLLAEYFEQAWVVVLYDSDSRRSCGCYGTPQHLALHHEHELIRKQKLEQLAGT